jgi:hypothetical protein
MSNYKNGGWEKKYQIKKWVRCLNWSDRNGGEEYVKLVDTDPEARYFVLRFDTDPHARKAMLAYANSVESDNAEFANDIREMLDRIPLKTES